MEDVDMLGPGMMGWGVLIGLLSLCYAMAKIVPLKVAIYPIAIAVILFAVGLLLTIVVALGRLDDHLEKKARERMESIPEKFRARLEDLEGRSFVGTFLIVGGAISVVAGTYIPGSHVNNYSPANLALVYGFYGAIVVAGIIMTIVYGPRLTRLKREIRAHQPAE